MVDQPFQQPSILTDAQSRTLALAGVFQAAQLTHLTALAGTQRSSDSCAFYFEQLIKASLNIRPSSNQPSKLNPLDLFGHFNSLTLGLQNLEDSVNQPFSPHHKAKTPKLPQAKLATTYAISLLQLEKKIYSNPIFVEKITQTQQKILQQLSFFDQNYLHPSIIANLAQTYLDTAAQIEPRILVRGSPEAFKDTQHTNRIRAMLFTGLQLAHLWRQMGGRSRHLIFSKRKIKQNIHAIARMQFQLADK